MRKYFTRYLRAIVALAPLSGCAWANGAGPPELCAQIKQFATQVPVGAVRIVSIAVTHAEGAAPSKRCTASPFDDVGASFCRYLSAHVSGEMLSGNAHRVLACLAGTTFPTAKHLFTDAMSGSVTVSNPFELKNVEVKFDYSYRWRGIEKDYLMLTVSGLADDQ